ncbi:hypothetical protein CDL15_Pgr005782 [Punica granatum]|uniref:Seed maturation-like protein n=1 Tax=Punica granatum TaxID=22663 RepID=A0A218WFL0_PUNGR|nr:hypothetical protein CDL15_Pgr005782 [Punica granatum]
MAASARAFIISRLADLSPRSPPLSRHLRTPFLPSFAPLTRRRADSAPSSATVSCLSGGLSDEFVSTRKSSLDQGFSVIANMLKRIEPLDNSVISKGVSDSAKDSMKQTISTMLGLLPSDQFSVTVTVSKHPLYRLLVSSIITGYTLWNAEYRISLMRNFDISPSSLKSVDSLEETEDLEAEGEKFNGSNVNIQLDDSCTEDLERIQVFGDLSPEALSYIQQLQSELHAVEEGNIKRFVKAQWEDIMRSDYSKELCAQKQENKRMEFGRESRNDLLEYLRSLDSDMVNELSRPSSVEVEEIIQRLVQNILRRFFKIDTASEHMVGSLVGNAESCEDGSDESRDMIGTSRDYLAKLLFWYVTAPSLSESLLLP